jgi:Flp pilus assembly protein TadB
MHFLHVINSDCQTRLLNVFGQIAMFWETKRKGCATRVKSAECVASVRVLLKVRLLLQLLGKVTSSQPLACQFSLPKVRYVCVCVCVCVCVGVWVGVSVCVCVCVEYVCVCGVCVCVCGVCVCVCVCGVCVGVSITKYV